VSFPLFATLRFNAPGVEPKLKSIQKSFKNLKRSANTLGSGIRGIGEGARGLALATAPAGLFLGSAIVEAGKFEQSLDAVQSILRVNDKEMKKLADTTKFLGATTIFTSSEVNRGAQLFAQAGFTIEETMAGLPGVLNAAAAGEISVAQATNLVASSVRAFALEASDATKVADIMAETAALTNTNMLELGEGLKLSSAKAKGLGFTLAQTASAIGVISNVGVKGTLAGTALRNAMQKLSKPSSDAKKILGDLGVIAEDSTGKLLPFSEIFLRINQVVGKNKSKLEDARKAAEIFGIRGEVAFGAFREQAQKTFPITAENIDKMQAALAASSFSIKDMKLKIGDAIPNLVALDLLIENSAGAAQKMANVRLDNLFGQVKLLSSAFNNLQIEVGSLLAKDLQGAVTGLTDAISVLSFGFRSLNMNPDQIAKFEKELAKSGNQFVKFIPMAKEFAAGFKEGFKDVVDTVRAAFTFISDKFTEFRENTGLSARDIGKFVGQFLLIAAIAAPVFVAIAAGIFVVGQLATGLVGIFQAISGTIGVVVSSFNMMGAAYAAVGVAFKGVTFIMLLPFIKIIAVIALVTLLLVVFKDKFMEIARTITGFFIPQFQRLGEFFSDMFGRMGGDGVSLWESIKSGAITAWRIIKDVVGGVINFLGTLLEGAALIASEVFGGLLDIVLPILNVLFQTFRTVLIDIGTLFGDVFGLVGEIFGVFGDLWKQVFGGAEDNAITFKVVVLTVAKVIGLALRSILKVVSFVIQAVLVPVATVIGTLIKLIVGFFRLAIGGITAFVQTGRDLINTIGDAFSNAGATIREKFGSVFGFIKEAANVFSQGKAEGGIFKGIWEAAVFVKDAVIDAFAGMGTAVLTIMNNLWKRIKTSAIDAGKNTLNTIGGFINTIVPDILKSDDEKKKGTGTLAGSGISFSAPGQGPSFADVIDIAKGANNSAKTNQAVNSSAPIQKQTDALKEAANKGNDKPIIVNSRLECDGQVLARAVSKANGENSERQGIKSDCFKRGLVERAPTGT